MRLASLVVVLLATLGCGPADATDQCETTFPQSSRWYNPGTHFPSIAMDLLPDGTAKFIGGFQYYQNPQWRYDVEAGELALTFPNMTSQDVLNIRQDHVARGFVDRIDENTKTLFWKVDSCTDHIYFQLHRFGLQTLQANN